VWARCMDEVVGSGRRGAGSDGLSRGARAWGETGEEEPQTGGAAWHSTGR
jgi:hypothetical protein